MSKWEVKWDSDNQYWLVHNEMFVRGYKFANHDNALNAKDALNCLLDFEMELFK